MQSPSRQPRRPIFRGDNGTPICVFIDPSVKKEHHRRQLREDIENYGGKVIDTDEGADTVISLKREERRYAHDLTYICSDEPGRKKTWVEHPSWVRLSIEQGNCEHVTRQRKGMGGGSLGKRTHVAFTPEEEEKLCKYLAKRIPDGDAGGRRGEGVYKELAVMASQSGPDGEFYWVNNHPWQSWRNRFNKNFERLNAKVDAFAAEIIPSDRQLYHLDRRLNKRTSVLDLSEFDAEEEYDEAYDSAVSFIEEHRAARKGKRSLARRRSRQMQQRRAEPVDSEADSEEDIARSRRKGRQSSPLFSGDERHKSPLFSEGEEEAGLQPLKEGNMVSFQPDDRDYEAILDNESGPFQEFQPGSESEELPPGPSQAFFSSQKTLVEQPISTRKSIPSSVSRHRRQTQQEPPVQNPEPQAGPSQPSRLGQLPSWVSLDDASDGHASPVLSDPGARSPSPRPTSSPRKAAIKTQQPPPKQSGDRKRKATTPPNDAPARNTRARSRSISVEPPTQLPIKTRKKQPELQPVMEAPPEPIPDEEDIGWPDDGNEAQAVPLPPIPYVDTVSSATSNQVDEMDVQGQLIADVTNSHVSGDEQEQDEEESTLESDDAQVDDGLRNPGAANESISQFPPSTSVSVTNMLANLVANHKGTMNPSQPGGSGRIPQLSFQISQPSSRRASNIPYTPPTADLGVITPRHRPSSSSEDIFPIPGTRASAMKKKIQEVDKTTPYKPPLGTKAARIREREEETAEETRPITPKRVLRPRQK